MRCLHFEAYSGGCRKRERVLTPAIQRPLYFYVMDFSSFDLLPNSGVMLLVFSEMSYLLLSQPTFFFLYIT
jgi:hypothetical protein